MHWLPLGEIGCSPPLKAAAVLPDIAVLSGCAKTPAISVTHCMSIMHFSQCISVFQSAPVHCLLLGHAEPFQVSILWECPCQSLPSRQLALIPQAHALCLQISMLSQSNMLHVPLPCCIDRSLWCLPSIHARHAPMLAAGSRPASAKRPAPSQAAAPAPKRQATKQEDEDVMDLLQAGHRLLVPYPFCWCHTHQHSNNQLINFVLTSCVDCCWSHDSENFTDS